MAGRPPFCLKSRTIGQVRRDCEGPAARRSYADTARYTVSQQPGKLISSRKLLKEVVTSVSLTLLILTFKMTVTDKWRNLTPSHFSADNKSNGETKRIPGHRMTAIL